MSWTNKIGCFLALIALVVTSNLSAQVAAPKLLCISVETNGDITITWEKPPNPNNEFVSYDIQWSVNGGPFINLFTSTIHGQQVYTHAGAGFGASPNTNYLYRIITNYNVGGNPGTSNPSDTLTPINPNLSVSGNVSGNLIWNYISPNGVLPSSDPNYEVERRFRFNSPVWGTEANPPVGQEIFRDTVARCHDTVFYRVSLRDQSGCVSTSLVVNAELLDNLGAATMTYTQVTVDNQNGVTSLHWNKHPDPSVTYYRILYRGQSSTPGPGGVFIDSVGVDSLFVIDATNSAFKDFQCYQILAYDSCGKTQGSGNVFHCTMNVDHSYDNCKAELTLFWNPYIGWNKVKNHNIYQSINNGPYKRIDSIPGTDTSVVIGNVNSADAYAFYIEAIDETGAYFSHSQVFATRFSAPNQTKYCTLRSATVRGANEEVWLRTYLDKDAPIQALRVYRAFDKDGPFQHIQTDTPSVSVFDTVFFIKDNQVRPEQLEYYYYVEVIDNCGNAVIRSNTIRSILLDGTSDKNDMISELTWRDAFHFDSTQDEDNLPFFEVFKSLSSTFGSNPLLKTRSLYYTDDFSSEIGEGGRFCYYIEYIQPPTLEFPLWDTSYSNSLCFNHEPDVFIANSFTPNEDGLNETWRPYVSYVVPVQDYRLRIIDRWGRVIYESTEPSEGWDGKINEKFAPAGVYVYEYSYVSANGSSTQGKGSFQLVR
ncbi:gliding motility-associated C-terminal domain-containing protein [bacterium SCSIO 12741]|nr:gliding motility-associated C-terminal domain-containing protein [bacterium SCSIO 12741]